MADAKGGYVERKSVTDIIRSDMQASGKPTGPNDAVLNFNTEVQAGPLGKDRHQRQP